jgi:predicted small lipoprotein YifL
MLLILQILVRTLALGLCVVALMACGQQGALYLPQTGGTHQATLPESMVPELGSALPAVPAAIAASSPLPP